MRITEDNINHNALRLISDEVSAMWELDIEKPDEVKQAFMNLARIDAYCTFARTMKNILQG